MLTSILDFESKNSSFKLKSLETKHTLRDSTILVKKFGTLCVSGEENVIQVDPSPPGQCWVLQTPFAHLAQVKDLKFVREGGGVGYKWWEVSYKFHAKTRVKGKVPQNLLPRRTPFFTHLSAHQYQTPFHQRFSQFIFIINFPFLILYTFLC